MKLIIDIPNELAEKGHWYTDEELWAVVKAVQNGIPLPKGHGRLIDADAYAKKYNTNINGRIGEEYIFAPTIIEADKETE